MKIKAVLYTVVMLLLCGTLIFPQPAGNKNASKKPMVTFVELGSVNCIPCKQMQPVMI